jgi:apolipoprotein D and lipocalin family protein
MKVLFLALLFVTACVATDSLRRDLPPLQTASWIDLSKYTGLWYEIAVIPYFFERGCYNTRATYTSEQGYVGVLNECNRGGFDAPLVQTPGKAYPDATDNAKLQVYFTQVQPLPGNYWVIDLDPDYQWSIVGNPTRRYGWILARTPTISQELLD